jgi:cytochrome c oxidase cbb3-type subunit 1
LGGLLFALAAAAMSDDPLFRCQALIFVAAAVDRRVLAERGDERPACWSTIASKYMDGVVRAGVIATMFWGAVGHAGRGGRRRAADLAEHFLLPDFGWLNFGRLRPLHTSAVIFAFGGNALICTSFYVVQRTCRARLFGGDAAAVVRVLGLPAVHRHGGRPAT